MISINLSKMRILVNKTIYHFSGVQGTKEIFDTNDVFHNNNDSFHRIVNESRCDAIVLLPSQYIRWSNIYTASSIANLLIADAHNFIFNKKIILVKLETLIGRSCNSHIRRAGVEIIKRALCSEPIEIYGDGSQVLDFQFVDDVCEAFYDLTSLGSPGFFSLDIGEKI